MALAATVYCDCVETNHENPNLSIKPCNNRADQGKPVDTQVQWKRSQNLPGIHSWY